MRPRQFYRASILFTAVVFGLFALAGTAARAQAPVITALSTPRQVVTVGQSLTLSVTATDAASYQWKRNGLAVPGATAASYAITSAVPVRDNGWYQVVATNMNGSTTSAVVFVNVAVSPAAISMWGSTAYGQTTVPPGLTNIAALAGGESHSLALKADGTVVAWGLNNFGQTTVPTGLSEVVAIAGGSSHSLALKADGTVVAWGSNASGQTAVPAALAGVAALAAGSSHCLALKADGTVVAWGFNSSGQATVPAGLTSVVGLFGGSYHSLALKADGTVVGWGSNEFGQATVPTGLTNVVTLTAGRYHSLALKADGTVVAWGKNDYGQTTVPAGLGNVLALSAGGFHNLALRADGVVTAWGYNGNGQTIVPPGLGGGLALAAGYLCSSVLRSAAGDLAPTITTHPLSQTANLGQTVSFSIVATAGTASRTYQWRKGGVAIAGATSTSYTISEVVAGSAGSFDVVVTTPLGTATSDAATLAVNAAPVVSSTGSGRYVLGPGQNLTLTLASSISAAATVQWKRNGFVVSGATARSFALSDATAAHSGYYQAVYDEGSGAITSAPIFVRVAPPSTQLLGWGDSSANQLAFPSGLSTSVAVAGGGSRAPIALRADGTVVTWGYSAYSAPSGLGNVVAVAAGDLLYLALKADGTVVAWGDPVYGKTTVPAGLTKVVAVAAGLFHGLALKSDGTVVAWGENNSGETSVPPGLTGVAGLAAGYGFSLALKSDGTVVAWGNNSSGQCTVPPGLTGGVSVAAGDAHSLALTAAGTVVAWGNNIVGQTAVPAGLSNVVAITASNTNSMALTAGGTVVVWGNNSSNQNTVPGGLNSVFAIGAGLEASLVLRDPARDLAPTITTHPASQVATKGENVQLSVAAAAGTAPLTYRWRKDNVDILGATSASYTINAVSAGSVGSYDVVVANYLGSVTSNAAVLSLVPAGASAAHAVTRSGYVPSGTVTIVNTLNYPAGTTLAQWRVLLPDGWSYASSADTAATTRPAVGASGLVEWIWSTPPGSPIAFSYTLNVPAGATGALVLTANGTILLEGETVTMPASPNPLTINPAGGKHSADTDGNGQISLAELTRVIDLYNARSGTVRTGRYLVATATTEDGFGPDATNSPATLARYHAADTNQDGRFRLTELTRVIELYNARSGGTRNGAYHVQASTEDGFAAGP